MSLPEDAPGGEDVDMPQDSHQSWKQSLGVTRASTATPGSRAETPNVRWPPAELFNLGLNSRSSRTPTPLPWSSNRDGVRSATPNSSCVSVVTGPLARSAALELHTQAYSKGALSHRDSSRAGTALGFNRTENEFLSPPPLTARELHEQRKQSRSPFELDDQDMKPLLLQAAEAKQEDELDRLLRLEDDPVMQRKLLQQQEFEVLFRKAAASDAEIDDNRPTRSRPPPPGALRFWSQAESELMASLGQGMQARAMASTARRKPYGGRTREYRPALSPPAKLAAPVVYPHNAWCTFITWIPPADGSDDPEFTYEVNIRTESSEHCLLLTDLGEEPQTQINGLEVGETYYFQVRASNTRGPGEWSMWSEGYQLKHPPMQPPRDSNGEIMEPATSSDSATSAKLEWDEPCSHGAPVIGYKIQYGPDPNDPSSIQTITLLLRRTWVVVNDLKPTNMYFFRVQALNEVGESDWTRWSEGVATKAVRPETPSAPELKQAETRALTLKWSEPFACGFRIERYDMLISCEDASMNSATVVQGVTAASDERTLYLNDLKPLHQYYFKVRAVSKIGMSDWSDLAGPFKTKAAVPMKCKDLRVTRNDEVGKVRLEWKVQESFRTRITSFILRWSEEDPLRDDAERREVPAEGDLTPGSVVESYVDGLEPGTRFFICLAAISQAGAGPYTEPIEVDVHPDRPSRPAAPTCKVKTTSSFLMQVEDVALERGSPIFRYEMRWSGSPQMTHAVQCPGPMKCIKEVDEFGPRMFEYAVNGFAGKGRGPYYFQVRCWNSSAASDWSPPSDGCLLNICEPSKMAAPHLVEADSPSSLIIEYMPTAELGEKMGGGVLEYELRYSREVALLADPDAGVPVGPGSSKPQKVSLFRWPAPQHGKHTPVRVPGLVTGRSYFFQIRALSVIGSGPWSDTSDPFKTLPSAPECPEPVNVESGAINPFSAKLLMTLPESNGAPIKTCRLRYLGPNWKTRPPVTEWRELKEVIFDDCEISQRPRREDEDLENATETIVTNWEFTVLHLEPGATYRFMFSCINEAGESPMSEISDTVTTMPTHPEKAMPPYQNDEREDSGSTHFTFTWDAPHDGGSDITSYNIIWANNMRFQGFKVVEGITENHYTLDGLDPNAKYFVRVAANNEIGAGKYSECIPHQNVGIFSTIPRIPSAPRDPYAETITDRPGAALVRWQKPADDGGCMVSRYKLTFCEHEDFVGAEEQTFKAMREARFHELKPDTTYFFKVRAMNAVGDGPESSVVSAKTLPVPPTKYIPPATPGAPELELVEDNGKQFLKATWKCPENFDKKSGFIYDKDTQTHMITHYNVYMIGGYPEPTDVEHEELKENIQQVRDRRTVPKHGYNVAKFDNLIPGRYYKVNVKAFSEAGESEWSTFSKAVRAPPGIPDPIEEVSIVGTTKTSVSVSWTCPAGNGEAVTHFRLRCRQDRVLRGWENGKPFCPEDSPPGAGEYEDVNTWWDEVEIENPVILAVNAADAKRRMSVMVSEQVLQHEFHDLQPASYYTVEVCALNAVGRGESCMSGTMLTRSTDPAPPGHCVGNIDAVTKSSVTFNWQAALYTGGEPVTGYEVRWIGIPVNGSVPMSIDAIIGDESRAQKVILGPDTLEYTAKDLYPGDGCVPVVRCWTEIGSSGWSRMPHDGKDLEAFFCLPDVPQVVQIPPVIERTEAIDHRLWSYQVSWKCPETRGRPILKFAVRIFRVEDDDGSQASLGKAVLQQLVAPPPGYGPPPASENDVQEFIIERPELRDWEPGETITIKNVHKGVALHKALIPGVFYAAHVLPANEVGDAEGWGPSSICVVGPPNYPSKPVPMTSPWQWPRAVEVRWKEPWMQGAPLQCIEVQGATDAMLTKRIKVSDEMANKKLVEREIYVGDLDFSTEYFFRFRVKNEVGWSQWSDVSPPFKTGACKPAPPAMPRLVDIDMEMMRITWTPPNNHGAAITKYEVFLADQERVPLVKKLVDNLNEAASDEDRTVLIEALPPKEHCTVMVEEFAVPDAPEHMFEGLLGGLDYAVALRAFNAEGWSDWSEPLDTIRSPTSHPVESPAPWLLEATQNTLRTGFSIPYDNGAAIHSVEIGWVRIAGPMERHLALGGKVTTSVTSTDAEAKEGSVTVQLPPGKLAKAKPDGVGGSWEGLIEGLAPGTEYDVQVCAINEHGPGDFSIPLRMTCAPGMPDRPGRIRHAVDQQVNGNENNQPSRSAKKKEQSISDQSASPVASDTEELDHAQPPATSSLSKAVQGGAIFFRRTGKVQKEEVISMGATTKKKSWALPGFSSSKVQPS